MANQYTRSKGDRAESCQQANAILDNFAPRSSCICISGSGMVRSKLGYFFVVSLQEKVCLRYEAVGLEENEILHEAEMANLLRHENVLAFYGVVIASSYSPSLALVSS